MSDARVLLVDEDDDFLDGLSAWIAERPGFRVAGVAHSGAEAFVRIARLAPDLVLMNMTLPDMSGLAATREIRTQDGAPLVILMTFHDLEALKAEAKLAGAAGCIAKPEIARDFVNLASAIWELSGELYRFPRRRT